MLSIKIILLEGHIYIYIYVCVCVCVCVCIYIYIYTHIHTHTHTQDWRNSLCFKNCIFALLNTFIYTYQTVNQCCHSFRAEYTNSAFWGIQKKLDYNWDPWIWHQWIPKRSGVIISVWFSVHNWHILHVKLILINSAVEDRIQKMSVHVSYLSQMYPFSLPSLFEDINITSPRVGLVVPSVRFLSGFPTKPFVHFSPKRATWSAHLIPLDVKTRIILGEQQSSQNCSLLYLNIRETDCFIPHVCYVCHTHVNRYKGAYLFQFVNLALNTAFKTCILYAVWRRSERLNIIAIFLSGKTAFIVGFFALLNQCTV